MYRAKDTRLDRIVAIKILSDHPAGKLGLRERFEREARAIASLNHPLICTVYDGGEQDIQYFLEWSFWMARRSSTAWKANRCLLSRC